MARYCPECGSQFAPQAKFCVSCGARVPSLGSAAAAAADEPTMPSPTLPDTPESSAADQSESGPGPGQSESGPGPGRAHRVARSRPTTQPLDQGLMAWPDDAARRPMPAGGGGREGASAGASVAGGPPEGERRRSRRSPFVVLGVAVVLLLLVAAVAFSVVTRDGDPVSEATPPSSEGGTTASTNGSTRSGPTAERAKAASDAITVALGRGQGSRETLVRGISTFCGGDRAAGQQQIREALEGRLAQLAKLNEAGDEPFREVRGGPDARDKLRAALQASADADEIYLRLAQEGTLCARSQDPDLVAANRSATTAKDSFLATWNPIARSAGVTPLASDDI